MPNASEVWVAVRDVTVTDPADGTKEVVRRGKACGRLSRDRHASRCVGADRAYEASEMVDAPSTGATFMLYGDFSRYVIVDRVGLTVELISASRSTPLVQLLRRDR